MTHGSESESDNCHDAGAARTRPEQVQDTKRAGSFCRGWGCSPADGRGSAPASGDLQSKEEEFPRPVEGRAESLV